MNLLNFMIIGLIFLIGTSPPAAAQTNPPARSWKFDFTGGHKKSGYLPVLPGTRYSPETGYGFDFGSTAPSTAAIEHPFFFSVRLPEGDYNVTVVVGDSAAPSITTIKAECRRLMVERIATAKGQFAKRTFTVHVRDSMNHITGIPVRLKPREYVFLHWDDKLTLEFTNIAPKLCTLEISPAGHPLTVFLAGNSTVVDQAEEPWAAWGQMIPCWFSPKKIVIANYAESGETLLAFVHERRLEKIWSVARPGDYLFIEFAHNDQKPGANYLEPFTTYKEELTWYVEQTRQHRMIPVLVTSMHRRNFDTAGNIVNTLGDYPEAMRQTAKELHTALIDLNAMSKLLFESWGPERSLHAFVHYPAHTFPGQDQELKDDTHFNSYGAYELAACVVKGIQENLPELAKYLAPGLPAFDPAHPDPLDAWNLPISPKLNAPTMVTGSQRPMPDEWFDADTRHKIIRLTRLKGINASFYFHNDPFIGNKMVFYHTDSNNGKQIYTVDLSTLKTEPITRSPLPMNGEIAARKGRNVYYQIADTVFLTNVDTRRTRRIFVFPSDFRGAITTLNADETLLAGAHSGDEAKEILKNHPEKADFFNRIYDAHIPHTLFTIDIRTGQLKKIHRENTWLGHVQFSPTDPSILMFCHEGPWQKVDRIWLIDTRSGATRLMHKRTVDNEIAGHEFFSPDGRTIWFDWQIPKGQTFWLGGVDTKTGEEKKYGLTRDEWSIHFNVSPVNVAPVDVSPDKNGSSGKNLFAGDGGDSGQVAKAKNGRWIYLFRPDGDHFVSEKLVNMKDQYYKLEPNVHFSPDGHWIIFRANFEGHEDVYAVEINSPANSGPLPIR
jgi:oligogalacturonide lyase